ncbi:hypothetical protein LXL04_022721 [Taraxacum kok-saghyz]
MDLEPGRCRRTDGKKWRCRLAVIPDQKYCDRHIHRGCLRSRKPVEDHKPFFTSATITVLPLKPAISPKSDTRNHNKNSFKIKKRSREEDACGPLEFIFSPKSVLVEDSGTSSNKVNHEVAVPESVRCRRTDGKNWRCGKITLQGQKYCAQHMHRGAKKVHNHQNSNTTLSLSVGDSYGQKGNSDDDDDGGDPNGAAISSSSSSDATTISM